MISVTPFLQDVDIFDPLRTVAARSNYAQALSLATGKRLYSITQRKNLKRALENLHRAGLDAAKITNVEMPFYSHESSMELALIEVKIETQQASDTHFK
jgi:hypothetical protein